MQKDEGAGTDSMRKQGAYKYVGICLLTIQQATMPLMVRASRDRDEAVFITTVNVFFMDVIKLVVCSAILIGDECSISRFLRKCKAAIVDDLSETLKICIPSIIYNVQNNLYYIALTNLESTTFCVLYQMKILTTALMLRFLLGKPLSRVQWLALVILVAGVTTVQLQYEPPRRPGGNPDQSPMLGFIAVLTMCFTSAFAGVYMEKVLKGSEVSVWMQNIRLALLGLMISTTTMLYKDYETITTSGMLVGFDTLVWIMTTTNSVGGLLIAVTFFTVAGLIKVIKYADNILKAYAQSAAIVGAALGSWLLFDFIPNLLFMLGTALVVVSVYLYTAYPPTKASNLTKVQTLVMNEAADRSEKSLLLMLEDRGKPSRG